MRWNELEGALPQSALQHLASIHPSVEAFLVNRSKALTVPQGNVQVGGGATEAPASEELDTVAAWEAAVGSCVAPEWRSGTALMQQLQYSIQVLPTGCAAVDALLGGGLREGTVVEVTGESASGKTQLCLSAAATTALRGEPVMYVDTTGSFAPERVVQLAEAEAEAAASGADPLGLHGPDPELSSRVLGCISLLRPSNVFELLTLLDRVRAAIERVECDHPHASLRAPDGQLPPQPGAGTAGAAAGPEAGELREMRAGPRLVIVDSVSALLSTVLGSNQHTQGTTLVTAVGRTLKQLAGRHSLAVLVTNHVTTAGPMGRGGGGGGWSGADGGAAPAVSGVGGLRPALGEQWRPQPHMRVQLSWDDTQGAAAAGGGARVATLTASPLQACGEKAVFHILPSGLV